MDNVYGFTTTMDDFYFARVIEEASADTNFLLVRERHTITGETHAVLLVRKAVLSVALTIPNETLCGFELIDWYIDSMTGQGVDNEDGTWTSAFFEGDITDNDLEAVRHELRRIDNVLKGRVIRVEVESI